MASICINKLNITPENFPAYSSFTCNTPRRSLAGEMPPVKLTDLPEEPDLDASDIADFEFSFSDPVNILPADELFTDGKLFPVSASVMPEVKPETRRIINGVAAVDSFLYTPKAAPTCSSRWKELLGLKKLYQNAKTSSSGNSNGNVSTRSIKQLLNRSSKSSLLTDSSSSVNLPLLNDTDNELLTSSSSSRLSHSSSSSDDVHRLSLDSDKLAKPNPSIRPAMKTVKTRTLSSDGTGFGSGTGSMRLVSIDSPRMNSSGKIVFHSLERSSSSPSTFSGGCRIKSRGLMERAHSATVRFTPVLNVPVPVCSIRGSKFLSSSNNGGANKSKQINLKSKSDRS